MSTTPRVNRPEFTVDLNLPSGPVVLSDDQVRQLVLDWDARKPDLINAILTEAHALVARLADLGESYELTKLAKDGRRKPPARRCSLCHKPGHRAPNCKEGKRL